MVGGVLAGNDLDLSCLLWNSRIQRLKDIRMTAKGVSLIKPP